MDRSSEWLNLAWTRQKQKPVRCRLDERFLAGLDRPAPRSLLFLPDLHSNIGRSMAAMVATERYLWVNLAAIGKTEKDFLHEAPLSPTGHFATSVEAVVEKFREAKTQSAAFRKFIPWCSKSSFKGGDQSRAEDHRQDQKSRVANRAPPLSRSWRGKSTANKGRDNLRNVLNKRRGRPLHPKPCVF